MVQEGVMQYERAIGNGMDNLGISQRNPYLYLWKPVSVHMGTSLPVGFVLKSIYNFNNIKINYLTLE